MHRFHPAVGAWFERRFPDGPTAAQAQGWPHLASREPTLISAPTGSGKTLAGFLIAIDSLYQRFELGEEVEGRTQIVYVSPLKALAVDIQQNLTIPLSEIASIAAEMGLKAPRIRVEVRTGDTPPSQRAAMLREPPNILVTTPESLYLLLTAERSRSLLRQVDTVIVDEIHALARDKRGAHLALSLERLQHVSERDLVRVGLSATQHPIEVVARLLVGVGEGREDEVARPRCAIVDIGHQRDMELSVELPSEELGAVASREQMDELLQRLAARVRAHRTTLVFVNNRRMSERVAHRLAEHLGEAQVASHHGSLSKERRALVESRLRAGELRALVATASVELGIDIGPVELVCQIGSPRSMATLLQRVGRSGHRRGAIPRGVVYPTTRDELVECCAVLRGVRRGRLDAVLPPKEPTDILAQQIVAECSAEEWEEDSLYQLLCHAAPFAGLTEERFQEILELVSDGVLTGRGPKGAYLHRDLVNHRLRGRRGARLAALTSGGAIPETGDYRVLAEPDDTLVGTVNEDWAIESMAGDVFLLGSTSWRITRVGNGVVRVADAQGAAPSVPFWLGEAPSRSKELSQEVSELRSRIGELLVLGNADGAVSFVEEECSVDNQAATLVVQYLAAGRAALSTLPSREHLVVERFFDESGGMQVVLHSPFGARLNRALGLALRKRFCATFDFELQAAASDDAVLLSIGPQHSFPLEQVPRFLSSRTVEEVLTKAVLLAPMFPLRWRWNLNRSLTVLRFKGGRKNPPPIQRMEADDVMAAVFPALVACQNENPTGPIEPPDHPLVRQTIYDCLHEVMDVDGLRELVEGIERGAVEVSCLDTTEPSVLAHEIINGKPYTFLDDAPLEERRSRAVSLRRGLQIEASDLAQLDVAAIERVRQEAAPEVRDRDELHDLLLSVVALPVAPPWAELFSELVREGRAARLRVGQLELWTAAERRLEADVLWPSAELTPEIRDPRGARPAPSREAAAALAVEGHLELLGPTDVDRLSARTALDRSTVQQALAQLEGRGVAMRGHFDPAFSGEQWCVRRLLIRIHGYTQQRLRQEIEPVSAQDFMRFLLRWQRLAPGTQRQGREGVAATIAQLQGVELPVGSWEREILARRVGGYLPTWLDQLCLSGDVAWGRLRVHEAPAGEVVGSRGQPSRSTPVTLVMRQDLAWLLPAVRGELTPGEPRVGAAREVLQTLRELGALFPSDIASLTGRLPSEVEGALWENVGRGLVSADGFSAARSLLVGSSRRRYRAAGGLRRGAAGLVGTGGRWGLIPSPPPPKDRDQLAEALAEQLLVRWGVVFHDLMARETFSLPWREVIWALRRMEARGTIRGGRFVSGPSGEQYALPEAVAALRAVRRTPREGQLLRFSAVDPLNLTGVILPRPHVPAVPTREVELRDGLPLAADGGLGEVVGAPGQRPAPRDVEPGRQRSGGADAPRGRAGPR